MLCGLAVQAIGNLLARIAITGQRLLDALTGDLLQRLSTLDRFFAVAFVVVQCTPQSLFPVLRLASKLIAFGCCHDSCTVSLPKQLLTAPSPQRDRSCRTSGYRR